MRAELGGGRSGEGVLGWEMTVGMGDRLWLSFFKAEGRRLAFVGWELGFPGGATAVEEGKMVMKGEGAAA
ncbi:hypothetical protein POTOM_055407 [Populus tomentosa]|uniref:Uncharacterized protein n=1 Tax=Populus tomentosa TaxID=118781 RepID=A0A8X8C775_POPTO|nr:hypothetical protein POTOM_055407 [Populus tomentosa]